VRLTSAVISAIAYICWCYSLYADDIVLLALTPMQCGKCSVFVIAMLLTLISHLMPPNINAFCSYRKIVFVVSSRYYRFLYWWQCYGICKAIFAFRTLTVG